MSSPFQLNPRHQKVLWATVQRYVATAEPVGSRILVQEYNLKVSPATVRNAMGFLEKSGLLYQPYVSAGRVPSDSGYRLYVDRLMRPTEILARQVDSLLEDALNWDSWSFEAILRSCAQILSSLSGYLTLITVPQTNSSTVRHLQLIPVDPGQILMVLLLDQLAVQSIVVELPYHVQALQMDEEKLAHELQVLSNFFTQHLKGQQLSDIAELDCSGLDKAFQHYAETLTRALKALVRRVCEPAPTQFVISGLSEVLRQPEFSDSQQIQAIVQLLEEEQAQLWPLLFESPSPLKGRRVRVWIGSENPIEPMQSCALVSSVYGREEAPLGSLGVLGPTRMVYENAVAVVSAAADHLSEALR